MRPIPQSREMWPKSAIAVGMMRNKDYVNLGGISMLFARLLTGKAPCFHDVRTYWSPDAVKRVTGKTPEGRARDGFIHLINFGATAMDGTGCAKDEAKNAVLFTTAVLPQAETVTELALS